MNAMVISELFQLSIDGVPHMVKKLSPYRPDQPFHKRVGHGMYGIDLTSSTWSMRKLAS